MAISGKTMQNICDKAYPIGSYYFANDPTDPSGLFGGTWDQITDCFIKAATSSISQSGGSRQKTISNFCPSHTHTVSNHTHSIPNHSHSGASINHSHSIGTHSHSGSSYAAIQNHTHTLTKYIQGPPGTHVKEDNAIYPLMYYAYNNTYHSTFTFKTASTQNDSTTSSSAGSTSTSMDSLGNIGYTTTSLVATTISTESFGSNGSCTIDIIPPYRECYCWRRRA